MIIKIGQLKYNLTDIFMCIFVSILLAFRDYSKSIIFLSLVMLVWLVINKIKKWQIKKDIAAFCIYKLMFIGLSFVSSFWSVNPDVTHLCLSMMYRLIICLCVLLYVDSEQNFIKMIKFCIIGAILLCIRMIIVVPMSAWGNSRVGSYLSHDPDNSYGNTGITYVLGVVSAMLIANKTIIKNNKWRYLLIIGFILFSFMSGSKKQFFIILIAYFVFLLLQSNNYWVFLKNVCLYSLLVFGVLIVLNRVPVLYNTIGYRIESLFSFFGKNTANLDDLSTVSRISFLKQAFDVFLEHPFIGVGIDSFKYYNSYQFTWAECNVLELLADLGVIGFAIYYLPHIKIANRLFKLTRGKEKMVIMNITMFVILLFIDLTMVSYNETHLQFFLSILFAYVIFPRIRNGVCNDE